MSDPPKRWWSDRNGDMASPAKRPARRRNPTPISTELERFRAGTDSSLVHDAVAQIAMRLIDADDRDEFRRADGATTLGAPLVTGSSAGEPSSLI